MSNLVPTLTLWFKANEQPMIESSVISPADFQTLKEYFLHGKLSARQAAVKLTASLDLREEFSVPLETYVQIIIDPAVSVFETAVQKKAIRLLSVIRTMRKYTLKKQGKEVDLCNLFPELKYAVREWYSSLLSGGRELRRAVDHPLWISMNAFYARLTAANLCDCVWEAGWLCESFLNEQGIRENPTLYDVNVSAAAQNMIHAGFQVYHHCETNRTALGVPLRWQAWKVGFKEAQERTKSLETKKYAHKAAKAMDRAERHFDEQEQKKRGVQIGKKPVESSDDGIMDVAIPS